MNPIVEETALPDHTADPDSEPIYVEGDPLTPRLDRPKYEYEDEEEDGDGVGADGQQSIRSVGTYDDTDDAMSIARTFGVRSRAGHSLRHHSSLDGSLRQKASMPDSPNRITNAMPPLPPKSPRRHNDDLGSTDQQSFNDFGAGPSTRARPASTFISPSQKSGLYDLEDTGSRRERAGSVGSDSGTGRSSTPASSFYAKPKRKMQGPINPRSASLHDKPENTGDDTPPRSDRLPRSSDEGYDTLSNSTGSQSRRSSAAVPVPVDATLRSMPGVVGIGEGWAGGPQGQDKKRRLWFRRKSTKKTQEDPLALWSIQEGGVETTNTNGKAGPKKGIVKEAWNRSIGKFGSMPALVSGDQVDGNRNASSGRLTGIKALLSRSRLDLAEKKGLNGKKVDDKQAEAQEKKAKRRTVAFFGTSKSQVELSSPRASNTVSMPIPPYKQPLARSQSPPSPSPVPRRSATDDGHASASETGLTFQFPPPNSKSDQDNRRSSAPISTPTSPGGLPPPWRPSSFIIPKPFGHSPAPRPFSRHEDRAITITEEPDELETVDETRTESAPSLSATPGLEGPQTSVSSGGLETPRTRTNSAEGRSLKHKVSTNLLPEDEREPETPTRPKSSLARSTTPHRMTMTPLPMDMNESTPGLDTLHDWALEGKRPVSRAFRPAQDAPPKFPEPPRRSQTPTWGQSSFFDRIKQAFSPATPTSSGQMQKDLPTIPSRTSTPLNMPGAFPLESEQYEERKNDPLPASPYDITEAVARQMLATPSPSRPTSRADVQRPGRKRGLSGDLWPRLKRLEIVNEGGDFGPSPSRPTSRLEKRSSYATLAGRLGFGGSRRESRAGTPINMLDVNSDGSVKLSGPDQSPSTPVRSLPPLTVRDFGEDDLGLDDILDENRRMTLTRDLAAALPMPPAREEPVSPSTIASSPKTVSSSEATVLARSFDSDGKETTTMSDRGHKNHPSTSTATTFDLDELMTPEQIRRSFENGIRRSPRLSNDGSESDRSFTRQHWPTRKHTRHTSMGSIGELASEILKVKPSEMSKRESIVVDADSGEEGDELRYRDREERTMSFASQTSDMSSAMSMDDEEAVPMSAIRVASVQQVKLRQMALGPEIRA